MFGATRGSPLPCSSDNASAGCSCATLNRRCLVIPHASRRQPPDQAATPLVRTGYRRTKKSDDEIKQQKQRERQAIEEQERRLARADLRAAVKPRRALLLVDGYNVIYKDPSLADLLANERVDLGYARAELEKWIVAYAEAKKINCIIVYDAMHASTPHLDNSHMLHKRVQVVYTRDCEADTYIIQRAEHLHSKDSSTSILLASADNRIRSTSLRSDKNYDFNIQVLGVEDLIAEGKLYSSGRGVSSIGSHMAGLGLSQLPGALFPDASLKASSSTAQGVQGAHNQDLDLALDLLLDDSDELAYALQDIVSSSSEDDDWTLYQQAQGGRGLQGGSSSLGPYLESSGEDLDDEDLDLGDLFSKKI